MGHDLRDKLTPKVESPVYHHCSSPNGLEPRPVFVFSAVALSLPSVPISVVFVIDLEIVDKTVF